MKEKSFISIGKKIGDIDVRLSYKIVELFSEGLYASPNKAIEELTVNAFDAGALWVQILLSPNLHDQKATIAVIDNGAGMDASDLKRHWLIGISNKRNISHLPKGRQQIGKFGIGKLATYVLAGQLTHISKQKGKYFATSMDYTSIDRRVGKEVESKVPMKIGLNQLSEAEANEFLKPWIDTAAFKASNLSLFGAKSPQSWTVAIMSSLKPKVHEIKPRHLEWVLRTAMPLRPDFCVWLNGKQLVPSKQGKGLLKRWVIGKDLVALPRPSPKDIEVSKDDSKIGEQSFGLNIPGLGRITGYAEAYKDLLTGKSDEIGRSHGFFVYVFDRLINVDDGHFGISPDELRHGTFGRFRAVVNMNGLDEALRANREALMTGPLLAIAQDVLRGIFNAIRPVIDKHDSGEEPGMQLARKIAASPASLSRVPIIELARAVLDGKSTSRSLIVPKIKDNNDRDAFIGKLEKRAAEAENFISGLTLDYNGSAEDGIARYDTETGKLRINAWHPFVAAFYDEFVGKASGKPLELLSMAEVLVEAHLYSIGVSQEQIIDFLSVRDRLLRHLANESGQQSAFSIAASLREARNNPDGLEDRVCAAFRSLGFEVIRLGGSGKPDGVATAYISGNSGTSSQYKVSLEAKSKPGGGKRVANSGVRISTIARQRDSYNCQHAIVVGPDFSTQQGEKSSLAQEIDEDRKKKTGTGETKTITLITIDDLARLVGQRPVKRLGLRRLRELFECRLPKDASKWVDSIQVMDVKKPPYAIIVRTIENLQKKYAKAVVTYAALRVELSHAQPPIEYETDDDLIELCKGMSQMSDGTIFANSNTVELDQSSENAIKAIDTAMKDYPIEEQ